MEKLKHILDYKILQKWGFIWALKRDDGYVTSYVTEKTYHTDMFGFQPLSLTFLDPNFRRWHLVILNDKNGMLDNLFYGQLNNENLETVLEAIMIWKPKKARPLGLDLKLPNAMNL
jgi:hypothetical protein